MFIVNLANADMVAANPDTFIEAVQYVDTCLDGYCAIRHAAAPVFVIADHGQRRTDG